MFKTIMWATDGSDAADRALPFAKALADEEGGRLAVVHSKEMLVGRAGGYPVLADEDELEAKIREQVEGMCEEGLNADLTVISGSTNAAHMLADTARQLGVDVIVVGTRGHAPIAGLFVGGVTQRLLHIAPCPVLAVPAKERVETREALSVHATA